MVVPIDPEIVWIEEKPIGLIMYGQGVAQSKNVVENCNGPTNRATIPATAWGMSIQPSS